MMHATISLVRVNLSMTLIIAKKKKNLRIQKHPLVQDCINTQVYSTVT